MHVNMAHQSESVEESVLVSVVEDYSPPESCSDSEYESVYESEGNEAIGESSESYTGIIQGYMFEPIPGPFHQHDEVSNEAPSQEPQPTEDRTSMEISQ